MMTDRKALLDQNETPDDVATLYSWANLHGAKYRDFSASRAQTREKARLRVQQSIEEERTRVRQDAEAQRAAEAQRLSDGARAEEAARQAQQEAQRAAQQLEAQRTAQLAAQQAAHEAAQEVARQSAQEAAHQAAMQAAHQAQLAQQAAREAQAAQQAQVAQQAAWPQPPQDRFAAFPPAATTRQAEQHLPPQPEYVQPQAHRPAAKPLQFAPLREENSAPRNQWAAPEPREAAGRPAWLMTDQTDVAVPPVAPQIPSHAPEDTLQGSRERMTSRWFALKGVFDGGASAPAEAAPAPTVSRAPVLAVFSLAGGVGKTSLVATLGRALSARGERVLLVDTAAYGLLPFYFGARDQRPGVLRTFSPPVASGDAPIQMVTFDPDAQNAEAVGQEPLAAEITKCSRGVNRVIVDLATASGAITRRVMRMSPLVLVPVVPDMNSVVSVSSIEAFFEHNSNVGGKPALPYYVLNQFDPSLPLHLDIREVLREQLGDRLLPFAIRRTPSVSEALAEGMTVMDYAPNSTAAEDFGSLAGWVKSLSAPASSGFRGVRWSER